MKKQPRVQKTQDQILREMEVARKRTIVVERFFPALKAATISISEAKMLVSATSSLIMEDVLQTMKDRKFDEIYDKLVKKLTSEGERVIEIEALLATLKGENLFVAREIIEGMTRAIEQMVSDEMQDRKLDTLTPDWHKMLSR